VPSTIKDVARLAGVSIATVSRVTSGSNTVSRKTEARVLEAVSQLEYCPDVRAAELARRNIGIPKMRGSNRRASDAMNRLHAFYAGANSQEKPR
jgi:DNA-binding LacI/PurR family transcriptional regulator